MCYKAVSETFSSMDAPKAARTLYSVLRLTFWPVSNLEIMGCAI